jgi:hypothetical protein
MHADQKLIDRIKKILSKTEEAGCTQAEADAAFAKASKLLAEHNLDMSIVTAEMPEWTEEAAIETGRWSLEHNLAYHIIKNYFFVSPYLNSVQGPKRVVRHLMIFGTPDNVQIAKFVFGELLDSFDSLWKSYRAANGLPLTEKRAYITGVSKGFSDKMREERAILEAERDVMEGSSGSTSIVLASLTKKTELAFQEKHSNMGTTKIGFAPTKGSQSSLDAGYKAGRSLNINRKISRSSNKSIEG